MQPPDITDTLDFKFVVVAIGSTILKPEVVGSKAGETVGFMPLLDPQATGNNTATWLSGLDSQSSKTAFLLQDMFDSMNKGTGRELFKIQVDGSFGDSQTNRAHPVLRGSVRPTLYCALLLDAANSLAEKKR